MKQTSTQVKTFRYYNCNPYQKLTDDCVIRAISASTGEDWVEIFQKLTDWAIKTGYMLNTPECYGDFLQSIGYVKQKQPVHKDGRKFRFNEFSQLFDGHAICHCGKGHITYVADNCTWDIWDVSNETVGSFWIHKAEEEYVSDFKECIQ